MIEELGAIVDIQHGSNSAYLTIRGQKVLDKVKLGDSIAVNGICLTVVKYDTNKFSVEVMDETLKKTNLGQLRAGDLVNLERALSLGDRLGGHLVSGHIDGVGIIVSIEKVDIAHIYTIAGPREVLDYVINKGSIAIDGISLTVTNCNSSNFSVSLIPHTANVTTLGTKKPGDKVNLEADMIGKYVAKFVDNLTNKDKPHQENRIDMDFLSKHGFF